MMPHSSTEAASIRMASAASGARVRSFHRMEAKPSGESTEYTACSCMATRLPTASAKAPPLPPSPRSTLTTGTVRPAMATRLSAMALPWPRSSASVPQKAPWVSTKQRIGRPNFSASRMRRSDLR